MSSSPRNHADIGIQYCRDVQSGKIPACHTVRRATKRHLDDIDRQKTATFPYRFDEPVGNRICRFIENLKHVKGPKANARENLTLLPFQCWLLTSVWGWLCDGGVRDGKRRFRQSLIVMPRGNAKSTLSSGILLYEALAGGEMSADCYVVATTRDQSKIIVKDAQAMARSSPKLMQAMGAEVLAHSIVVPRTNSKIEALSAEAHTLDGLSVHVAIAEELHAHPTRDVWDVTVTATAKRDNSLIFAITTAGTDTSGICFEVLTYLRKVLDGVIIDESMFGCEWTIDADDDWMLPSSWEKANPAWIEAVQPDVIAQLAKKAIELPSARPNFLCKHLDIWSSPETAWLPAEAWAKCADPSLDINDFRGMEVEIGLDLATKLDIASAALMFRRKVEGLDHYYLFTRNYLPESAINESRNASYRGWEMGGYLIATPGEVTDFAVIEADLLDDSKTYKIRSIAYDPWQASDMAQRLIADGANAIEYRNTVANYSAPMKELAGLVLQGRLHHDGDPVLAWAVSNTVTQEDRKGNQFPRKQRAEQKIDPVVAAISAMGRWMLDIQTESIYERKRDGFLILG